MFTKTRSMEYDVDRQPESKCVETQFLREDGGTFYVVAYLQPDRRDDEQYMALKKEHARMTAHLFDEHKSPYEPVTVERFDSSFETYMREKTATEVSAWEF